MKIKDVFCSYYYIEWINKKYNLYKIIDSRVVKTRQLYIYSKYNIYLKGEAFLKVKYFLFRKIKTLMNDKTVFKINHGILELLEYENKYNNVYIHFDDRLPVDKFMEKEFPFLMKRTEEYEILLACQDNMN